MTDLILAVLHHILILGLITMLVMERSLLGATPVNLSRLAGLDAGYGLTALLVIVIGVCRVLYGARGWAFYEANPWFWVKVGAFAAMGLASLPPTLAFLKWRKALKADAAFQPPSPEIASARRLTGVQLILVAMVLLAAAAMARWPF